MSDKKSPEESELEATGVKGSDYLILDDYLPYRLLRVTSEITDLYDKRYKAELGITIPESRVIHVLARFSDISSREICQMTTLSKSSVSIALQRLEAAGVLTREANTQDQRLVTLTFTKKGNVLRKKLVGLALEMEADIIKFMGEPKAHDLMNILDGLRGYSDNQPKKNKRKPAGGDQ
ncbi:MarR family winged helix-turn-helix transcriptional regulator [Brucella anthropi]|jgi:DNA-binding MarR family transcriptional regulator|uniref:MarR family winged helix-turn-helix transcriptional regulator n=1 Tax=Brucella anthropi TaxID=529 RepID=UPI0017477ACA|nr:MarR family winged helix-turn-helix transcriptional regulator [Brucella anthropi]QOD67109.1 winged helix-turn-helix transcriptional regulator [Ochrobactrum sp. MT180101]